MKKDERWEDFEDRLKKVEYIAFLVDARTKPSKKDYVPDSFKQATKFMKNSSISKRSTIHVRSRSHSPSVKTVASIPVQ